MTIANRNIVNVDFGVCVSDDGNDLYYKVSVDGSVKQSLTEILYNFDSFYESLEEKAMQFEPNEKYSSSEKLFINNDNELVSTIVHFYKMQNIPLNSIEFKNHINEVEYYFAEYTFSDNSKVIGVKRPTQFKSLLNKRLISWVNDSLKSVPDDILKLDNDFDFVITPNKIKILHPTGFIYISDIDKQILEKAKEATIALGADIGFVSFEEIASFVETHKNAAKLVASIKSRNDLSMIAQNKLKKTCETYDIKLYKKNGKYIPPADKIIEFLQILDRRIYEYELTDRKEVYLAQNRVSKR